MGIKVLGVEHKQDRFEKKKYDKHRFEKDQGQI